MTVLIASIRCLPRPVRSYAEVKMDGAWRAGGLEGEYLAHLRRLSETCTEARAGGFFKTTSAN